MGYTHYWKYDPKSEEFQKGLLRLLPDAQLIIGEAEAIDIYVSGRGEMFPVTEGGIWFDGVAPPGSGLKDDDFGHETFVMQREHSWLDNHDEGFGQWQFDDYTSRGYHFMFCKTALKPYDLVVGTILLRAHYLFGLNISSDGNWNNQDEWGYILDFYGDVFGVASEMLDPDPFDSDDEPPF